MVFQYTVKIIVSTATLLNASSLTAANFTSGQQQALQHGIHEIEITSDSELTNPFDTQCSVTFTPSTGSEAITVNAFYDGHRIWRARLYVIVPGKWSWSSSSNDAKLDRQAGSFTAATSNLPGKLRPHVDNPKAWMTDDGSTFQHYGDTDYRLFHEDSTEWRDLVKNNAELGINSIRAGSLGGYNWDDDYEHEKSLVNVGNSPFDGDDFDRFDLAEFQRTDKRLRWMIDNYPEMYVQLILFGNQKYGSDGPGLRWFELSEEQQQRTLRYMLARWSAWPQVFYLIINDVHHDPERPNNRRFVKQVGSYIHQHDPFHNLLATGPNREAYYPYPDEPWSSYIHIEVESDLAAKWAEEFARTPKHVYMGEDQYEQDWGWPRDPKYMDYFQRRIFIAWNLSQGSGNYGGRSTLSDPYHKTGQIPRMIKGVDFDRQLIGLDQLPNIREFFSTCDLASFTSPADSLVKNTWQSDNDGPDRAKCLRKDTNEYLVYLPNAVEGEKWADVQTRREAALNTSRIPSFTINLEEPQTYSVKWYSVLDGEFKQTADIQGGGTRTLQSPWRGKDVLVKIKKR